MKTAKKLLSLLLCMCMLMTCMGFGSAYAEGDDHTHVYDLDQEPAWGWADDFSSATATFTCTDCGETADVTDNAPVETPVDDATCKADKVSTFAATVEFGGKTFTDTQEEVSVPDTMIPHSFTTYVYNKDATCTEDGTKTAECDYGCGEKDTVTDEGTMIPHSFTNYVYNEDATCTLDGTKTAECDYGCGEKNTVTDEGTMIPHKFTIYVYNDDATCTEDGTKTAECDYGCGEKNTVTDEGTMIPHKFTNYVPNDDATCTEDGTKTAKCDYGCGAEDTVTDTNTATGHTYGEPTWSWAEDNSAATAIFTCVEGDDTQEITATVGVTVVTKAGCTTDEVVTYTAMAAFDGKVYTDVKESVTLADTALKHSYDAETTAPTCLEDGYTTFTCTRCGDTYKDDYVLALGHSYAAETTEPTCLDAGYTTYTCTRCDAGTDGHTYTGNEVAALGHKYDVVTTEPTCLEAGYTTYTCTRCEAGTEGHTYTDNEVPALGHKYDVVTTEPTCLEPGYTTYTCTRCEAGTDGHTYQGNDVPALGHKYTIVFDKGDNDPKVDNTYFDQVNWYKQSENHLYKPATMTMAETHIFLCERCSSEDKQKDDNILKVELENTETGEHKILDKDEKTNESYWHFIDGYDPADDTIGKCYNVCLDDDCQDGAKALETNSYKETIPEKYQEKYAELVKANGGKQVVLYDHVVNDQIGWTYVEGTATCYFNGYDEGVCAHCGGKTRQIRKTDDKRPEHQYGDYHVVKDAVDEDHAHMRICTVEGCGHEEYGKHTFTAWEVVEKETLFKDRVEERHCVDCLDEEGNPYTETRVVESSNKIVVFIRWLAGLFAFKGSILYNAAKWLYDVLNPFKPIDG